MAEHYLGIDTGGTFTDFAYFHRGKLTTFKTLSTPEAPEHAIVTGIAALGLERLCKEGSLSIIHGTTVATNAALESRGVKTAYITNQGLADVLAIGRQNRNTLYDLLPKKATLTLSPQSTFEINVRRSPTGDIRQPLVSSAVDELIESINAFDPEAVAINLLYSFLTAADEEHIKARLDPKYFVSLSSEVLPEMGEYERGVATYLNASLGPLIKAYLLRLAQQTAPSTLAVMQSSGVTFGATQAATQAIRLLLSGPAGGIIGAHRLLNVSQLMTFDMGGTSTDVGLINGAVSIATSMTINDLPIAIPAIDIKTIGAGGGSIAFIDDGGLLQVGPSSAGAKPGPACYGYGGTQATVTDANVVLGRLPADRPLAGGLHLSADAAKASIQVLATRLSLTVEQTAQGIVRLANEKMTDALRLITIEKGINPTTFTLCCFGGAGGLHLCDLAENLGINEAIVPPEAGVFSALGMLAASPGRELSVAFPANTTDLTDTDLNDRFDRLASKGTAAMAIEGVTPKQARRTLDLRYQGQTQSLGIPFSGRLSSAKADFELLHETRYGHRLGTHIELVSLRVRLEAESAFLTERARVPAEPSSINASSKAADQGDTRGVVAWFARDALAVGERLKGPKLVGDDHTSVWVKSGWTIEKMIGGDLKLERGYDAEPRCGRSG